MELFFIVATFFVIIFVGLSFIDDEEYKRN